MSKKNPVQNPVVIASPSGKAKAITIGARQPLVLICGPCVIESEEHAMYMAGKISETAATVGIPLIYKSSYDKANRTSGGSFRGMGIEAGLKILQAVRSNYDIPVITDIHSPEEARVVAQVADILQIPAFLCRQTDLLLAAGKIGKPVMIKKGQFVHPADMEYAVDKIVSGGSSSVLLCERGSCFGYRELVVDFRSLAMMSGTGCPVVFDATHSVQSMGGAGGTSSGSREYVPLLARAAVAVGVSAVFLECHDHPDAAPSDGPNMIPLSQLQPLLEDLQQLSMLQLKTREAEQRA